MERLSGTPPTPTLYRIISDQLGSPVRVVNVTTGAVLMNATYDEWGQVTYTVGAGEIPFGFAGGLYDTDTKLVRFGARDYDPEVGRWVSKDPILFNGRQANLYVYVGNDPVNGVDPTGTWGGAVGIGGDVGYCFGLCVGSWSGSIGLYIGAGLQTTASVTANPGGLVGSVGIGPGLSLYAGGVVSRTWTFGLSADEISDALHFLARNLRRGVGCRKGLL